MALFLDLDDTLIRTLEPSEKSPVQVLGAAVVGPGLALVLDCIALRGRDTCTLFRSDIINVLRRIIAGASCDRLHICFATVNGSVIAKLVAELIAVCVRLRLLPLPFCARLCLLTLLTAHSVSRLMRAMFAGRWRCLTRRVTAHART